MNILILGSGGREHAFAWKISQSNLCEDLYVAPGNSGTEQIATNVDMTATDFPSIQRFVLENDIHMVVVGPEDPLVNGIHDFFLNNEDLADIAVIGPESAAARLEGSKLFAKEFMFRHQIPTARYQCFNSTNIEKGYQFLEKLNPPYVLKANGLAAGKGVLILDTLEEAKTELRNMILDSKFGIASNSVVIEEFLDGIELSCFVLTDGRSYKILPTAKDYKRIGEGDTGLNTGGMGAISPVPFADEDFMNKVEKEIVKPTIDGLRADDLPYKGFIFIGLINVKGQPMVIEYNVRMGDPETEVVIPRIKNDFVQLLKAVADETLAEQKLEIDDRVATTVVVVSGGYPEDYEKGKKIEIGQEHPSSIIFHAGANKNNQELLTSGGRVLAVTSYGKNNEEALSHSYETINQISFDGMYYRKDIGFDL